MLNLMKWDLINTWHKTKFFNISAVIIIVLSLLLPVKIFSEKYAYLNSSWALFSSIALMIYFVSGIIYILFKFVFETYKKPFLLETTTDRKAWQIILSRFLVICMLSVILLSLASLFTVIMSRFETENMSYFNFEPTEGYINTFSELIFYSTLIYFAYLISKSFKSSRKIAGACSVVILIAFSLIIGMLYAGISYLCGAEVFFFSNGVIGAQVLINNMDTNLFEFYSTSLNALLTSLSLVGCIYLLDKKAEL